MPLFYFDRSHMGPVATLSARHRSLFGNETCIYLRVAYEALMNIQKISATSFDPLF